MRAVYQKIAGCFLGLSCIVPALAADQAIVSKQTIYRGQVIERANLKAVKLVREPLIKYRFASRFDEILGQVAARTILAGRFIPLSSTKAPELVKAGAKKRVKYRAGGLMITLVSVALSDGSAGDYVKMRNPTTGKTFDGFVLDDGSIMAGDL